MLAAFAGFDGIQALSQIREANDRIRENFLLRTRLLERIRGDVYVSGTYVRDYLLEPESGWNADDADSPSLRMSTLPSSFRA